MFAAVNKYYFNKPALLGLILVLPTILFFGMTASHYLLGIDWLWTPFERAMANPQGKEIINVLPPVVFLGGTLAALVINISAMAGLKIQKVNQGLVSTLVIKGNLWNLAIIAVSFSLISLLLGYLVAENWQCWVGLKDVC